MTITVSISQFRENISEYLARIGQGDNVRLKDEKRNKSVARLVPDKSFNPSAFGRALKMAAGVFTSKDHPEWRTKRDITGWLRRERKSADRTF